jgi:hypothetical protein
VSCDACDRPSAAGSQPDVPAFGALATLRQDSLDEGAGTAGVSPAEATEILDAYQTLQKMLRRQVRAQLRAGNMKLVRNCDEVLEKFISGQLDYHSPAK